MYIRVRVQPKSRHESIKKVGDDSFEIAVREPAERNLANERVREIIAYEYREPVSRVRIVSGHHSPSKIVSIQD